MPTKRQVLGRFGEICVVKECACPKCKRSRSLKRLPTNFKCADVICDFCGYLAQVKALTVGDIDKIPDSVLGAAWGPQKERMAAAIYFPLFLVLVSGRRHSIFYLSADLQVSEMFKPERLFLHGRAAPVGKDLFTGSIRCGDLSSGSDKTGVETNVDRCSLCYERA
jgi:type II restriction enzyme